MPAVDTAALPGNIAMALGQTARSTIAAHLLPWEPALRPYAR